MRWYLDTEFLEDGRTVELISIALVSQDGAVEYYAGNAECDFERVRRSPWLMKHVVPHLPPFGESFWKSRLEIANDILGVLGLERDTGNAVFGTPEIWADFASYDWVAFCQLYGRMIDLPPGMPMFCMDLMQDLRQRDIHRAELPKQDPATEHDALEDARWLRQAHRFAQGLNWSSAPR